MTLRVLPAGVGEAGKCAKGAQAGYYYRAGSTNVWVFHLMGGGGCSDYQSCKKWADDKGSLDRFELSKQGTLWRHPDPAENPAFWNAHHVEVAYCTGDAHGGRVIADETIEIAAETEARPWGNYHFSGHLNVEAILSHIRDVIPEFQNAERLLLSGQSAGGIGVFKNCEYIVQKVHEMANEDVQVSCAADAGFYYPGFAEDNPDVAQPPTPIDLWLQGELRPESTADSAIDPMNTYKPGSCLAMMAQSPNPRPDSLCNSAAVIYTSIMAPFYIIQNVFDLSPMSVLGMDTITAASEDGHAFIAYYGRAQKRSLKMVKRHPFGKQGDGLFLASCYAHGEIGPIDGHTSVQALGSWWSGDGALPAIMIDQCESSPTPGLPCGQDCPHAPAIQPPCQATLTHRCGSEETLQNCVACTSEFSVAISRAGCAQEDIDDFCELAGA